MRKNEKLSLLWNEWLEIIDKYNMRPSPYNNRNILSYYAEINGIEYRFSDHWWAQSDICSDIANLIWSNKWQLDIMILASTETRNDLPNHSKHYKYISHTHRYRYSKTQPVCKNRILDLYNKKIREQELTRTRELYKKKIIVIQYIRENFLPYSKWKYIWHLDPRKNWWINWSLNNEWAISKTTLSKNEVTKDLYNALIEKWYRKIISSENDSSKNFYKRTIFE